MSKVINRFINLASFVESAKTPVAADLLTGKEAWANGVKVVGEGTGGGGDYGYKRVSGVPDGAALLANAVEIEVEGVTYMPIYYMALYDSSASDTFAKDGTYSDTGADAYLFSDKTTLEVGISITHTWDTTQDTITDEGWGCRYVICYAVKSGYTYTEIDLPDMQNVFEIIGGTNLIAYGKIVCSNTQYRWNYYCKFIDMSSSTYYNNNMTLDNTIYKMYGLQELRLFKDLTTISGDNCCSALYPCKKIDMPTTLITISGEAICQFLYALNNLDLSNITTLNATDFCKSNSCLRYVDLSSITTITNSDADMLNHTKYIKLYNDFNISGVNFTGDTNDYVTKSAQWFYDLADWLYDRSSTTAGTLIFGSKNIAILNTLLLDDGVTPLTSIYDAKNWTRS